MKFKRFGFLIAGFCAGSITGLLGTGGGMILIPLLNRLTDLDDTVIFPTSVCTILPIGIISLFFTDVNNFVPIKMLLPYLVGGIIGGILAGIFSRKIPIILLHRALGILILWGGIRYIW